MLKNAYFLAKIGADTAEDEQHPDEILPIGRRGPQPFARPSSAGAPCAEGDGGAPGGPRFPPRGRITLAKLAKLAIFLQFFGGLVLGCIKTNFCKKICVRQHFSSSTRFASFCTAAISTFSQKIGLKNQQFP